jgi:hypothetical protein
VTEQKYLDLVDLVDQAKLEAWIEPSQHPERRSLPAAQLRHLEEIATLRRAGMPPGLHYGNGAPWEDGVRKE